MPKRIIERSLTLLTPNVLEKGLLITGGGPGTGTYDDIAFLQLSVLWGEFYCLWEGFEPGVSYFTRCVLVKSRLPRESDLTACGVLKERKRLGIFSMPLFPAVIPTLHFAI